MRKKNTNADEQRPDEGDQPPTANVRGADVRERLLDLAYDVSSYLRHQAQPTVRISAALLLAASLAACSGDQSAPNGAPSDVAPLTQEIRSGMPNRPGQYPVVANSIVRDQQGVYHFQWMQSGGAGGSGTQAAVSLLKLGQADSNTLVIPQSGDPLLNITPDTPIQLATTNNATPTTQRVGSDYTYWHPFYGGYYYGPRYYDPPVRTIPSTGGGTIEGSTSSVSPPAASARTTGVAHAVSGRAGGAGSGNAATNKSGASASGGGKGNASAPASSGFSGGSSASKGGGSASSSS